MLQAAVVRRNLLQVHLNKDVYNFYDPILREMGHFTKLQRRENSASERRRRAVPGLGDAGTWCGILHRRGRGDGRRRRLL